MITLNNILSRLESFASSHKMINTFSFGSVEDIDKTDGVAYPLMHVVQIGSTHDGDAKKKTYDLAIVFADRPTESEDKVGYQAEVQSDMEQCAEDLLNDIYNGGNIFTTAELFGIDSNGIEYFDEDNTNTLSGATLSIGLTVPYRLDACALPLDSITPTSTTCADATVSNSSGSYSVNVASGGTLVVPDTDITNSDDSFSTSTPSTVEYSIPDIVVKAIDGDNNTDTIATVPFTVSGYTHPKIKVLDQSDSLEGSVRIGKIIKITNADITSVSETSTHANIAIDVPVCDTPSGICYQSPILSQTTSYRDGDEGWQLANDVWLRTDPSYPTHKAKLDLEAADPFVTMAANNAFGNTARFTDEAGTAATYNTNTTSGLVIDHLTGFMWYAIPSTSSTWNQGIDNCVSSTQGSYSDWYLCPKNIFDDLMKIGVYTTGIPGFQTTDLNKNWTASTIANLTTNAFAYYSSGSEVYGYRVVKTNSTYQYVMVRRHY